MKKINKETNINIRTKQEFKDKFIEHCNKHRYVFSKRVRALMEMDMRGKIKI